MSRTSNTATTTIQATAPRVNQKPKESHAAKQQRNARNNWTAHQERTNGCRPNARQHAAGRCLRHGCFDGTCSFRGPPTLQPPLPAKSPARPERCRTHLSRIYFFLADAVHVALRDHLPEPLLLRQLGGITTEEPRNGRHHADLDETLLARNLRTLEILKNSYELFRIHMISCEFFKIIKTSFDLSAQFQRTPGILRLHMN